MTELIRGAVLTAAQADGATRAGLLIESHPRGKLAAVYFFDAHGHEVGCVYPELGRLTRSPRAGKWSTPAMNALQWREIGGRTYAPETLYNLRAGGPRP